MVAITMTFIRKVTIPIWQLHKHLDEVKQAGGPYNLHCLLLLYNMRIRIPKVRIEFLFS